MDDNRGSKSISRRSSKGTTRSNKSTGTRFEAELAERLAQDGWWVHLLTQSSAGQPADLIICGECSSHLIDCKDCANDKFALSRIEQNQYSAMSEFRRITRYSCYFALRMSDGSVYLLRDLTAFELLHSGVRTLNAEAIYKNAYTLEQFNTWFLQ